MRKSLSYNPAYALNAVCPYFTMFPLEYPLRILRRKTYKGNAVEVMDPFCGRGTTLYAARILGLSAWGIDTSPVAVAIARAKLASSSLEDVLTLANSLLSGTRKIEIPDESFFRAAYNRNVLSDLCRLRVGLLNPTQDEHAAALLRAAILGCLHGPLSKDPKCAGYFSNQMMRTFSPKPDYAVKYWKENGLRPPKIDVLDVLTRKLERVCGSINKRKQNINQVKLADSQRFSAFTKRSRQFSVVITSPPYYGMNTYVQDQWLRNWFLGGGSKIDYKSGTQLNHGGKDVFAESMGKVWKNMSRSLADDLNMHVRFGVIPSTRVDAKELFYASLEASGVRWKVVYTSNAKDAAVGKRQARQMNTQSAPVEEYDFHVIRA